MLGMQVGLAGWLPDLETLGAIMAWLLHAGAIGQTTFVVLWLCLPWWREWIGRALMVKSLALMIFLDSALVHHHLTDYPAKPYVVAGLFALVVLGIWTQVAALAHEMWKAWRQRRRVTGTDRHDDDNMRITHTRR